MIYQNTDKVEVARGQLTSGQINTMDNILVGHGLPRTSPNEVPSKLVYVCLNCGSIGEGANTNARDEIVQHYDLRCCGLTVVFHSNQKVLVDLNNLTIREI